MILTITFAFAENVVNPDNLEDLTEEELATLISGTYYGFTYYYDPRTGNLIIKGEGEMPSFATEKAPWSEFAKDVTQVVISPGITSISEGAFEGFSNLKTVTIPDTVVEIAATSFTDCEAIETVEFTGEAEVFLQIVEASNITAFEKATIEKIDAAEIQQQVETIEVEYEEVLAQNSEAIIPAESPAPVVAETNNDDSNDDDGSSAQEKPSDQEVSSDPEPEDDSIKTQYDGYYSITRTVDGAEQTLFYSDNGALLDGEITVEEGNPKTVKVFSNGVYKEKVQTVTENQNSTVVVSVIVYNEDDKRVSATRTYTFSYGGVRKVNETYEYEGNVQRVRLITYMDGVLTEDAVNTIENNLQIASSGTRYNSNGEKTETFTSEYGYENGNRVKVTNSSYDVNGVLTNKTEHKRTGNGLRQTESYHAYTDGGIFYEQNHSYEYDANGNRTKEEARYYSNGTITGQLVSTYENNQMVQSTDTQYNDGVIADMIVSTYQYENDTLVGITSETYRSFGNDKKTVRESVSDEKNGVSTETYYYYNEDGVYLGSKQEYRAGSDLVVTYYDANNQETNNPSFADGSQNYNGGEPTGGYSGNEEVKDGEYTETSTFDGGTTTTVTVYENNVKKTATMTSVFADDKSSIKKTYVYNEDGSELVEWSYINAAGEETSHFKTSTAFLK